MREELVVPAASIVAGILYMTWKKYSLLNLDRQPLRWPWQHQVLTVGVIAGAVTGVYLLLGD